jgi:hypothetical protein
MVKEYRLDGTLLQPVKIRATFLRTEKYFERLFWDAMKKSEARENSQALKHFNSRLFFGQGKN